MNLCVQVLLILTTLFYVFSLFLYKDDDDYKRKKGEKKKGQKKKKKNGQSSASSSPNKNKKKKKNGNKKSSGSKKNKNNSSNSSGHNSNKKSSNKKKSEKKRTKTGEASKKSALPSDPQLAQAVAIAPIANASESNASPAVSSQNKIGIFGGGLFGNRKPQSNDDEQCHIISGWDCPRFGRQAHPIDCQKYVWCTFRGNNTVYECGEDEAYDTNERDCSKDWSTCEALTDCLYDRELLEDPSDDQAYFICIEQNSVRKQKQFTATRRWCQPERSFDVDYQKCIPKESADQIEEYRRKRAQRKRKKANQKKGGDKKKNKNKKKKKSGKFSRKRRKNGFVSTRIYRLKV